MNMSYCRFHNTALDVSDCIDNMPENLQNSERYETADNAASSLEDALDNLDSAKSSIEEAIDG